ncbi:DUF3987 domain-containing protein [Streptomyces sp. NPDC094045]|uniref:DUF3987 domain-containing protein n=1 Tax=unclassified Streptomyces TaxID=2593676 RepID=UPI0033965288
MKYGPLGDAVANAMDHTEADPIGVYASALALYSTAFGGKVELENGRPVAIWTVLVGRSAIGRKGTALGTAKRLLGPSVGAFLDARTVSGISSGPSLVNTLYSMELESAGTETGIDGRAMCIEEEWPGVLKRSRRCPTFTEQMCTVWDGRTVRNITKGKNGQRDEQIVEQPLMGFHAHITPGAWEQHVKSKDALGGIYNRMLPVLVERSQMLPYNHKPKIETDARLKDAYQWAQQKPRVMSFTADAGKRYDQIRAEVEDRIAAMPEHLSCFFERTAEHVYRVAAVLTIPEKKTKISKKALEAAWAFVQCSINSVEKLVTASASGAGRVKSLPEIVRDVLKQNGGEVSSTLLLRKVQSRANATELKATVDDMEDVEYYKGKSTTSGQKPVFYRFTKVETEVEPKVVESPVLTVVGRKSSARTRPTTKAVEKPRATARPRPGPAVKAESANPLAHLL